MAGAVITACLTVPAYTLFIVGWLRGWGDDDGLR